MSAKKSPDAVKVLGMFLSLYKTLGDILKAKGGYPEMIDQLTLPYARSVLEEVAGVIINGKLKIPRSVVENLVRKESIEQGQDDQDWDRLFFWNIIDLTDTFGIPVLTYGDMDKRSRVPLELEKRLVGKKLKAEPLIVDWEGESHVVVDVCVDSGTFEIGQPINANFLMFKLAPAKYFDMAR